MKDCGRCGKHRGWWLTKGRVPGEAKATAIVWLPCLCQSEETTCESKPPDKDSSEDVA